MPRRHAVQTVYLIDRRYYRMLATQPPSSLKVGTMLRAACDQVNNYQGNNGRGVVLDGTWRVVADRLATAKEAVTLGSSTVTSNPLKAYSQFRIIELECASGGVSWCYRPKYDLVYLWWIK